MDFNSTESVATDDVPEIKPWIRIFGASSYLIMATISLAMNLTLLSVLIRVTFLLDLRRIFCKFRTYQTQKNQTNLLSNPIFKKLSFSGFLILRGVLSETIRRSKNNLLMTNCLLRKHSVGGYCSWARTILLSSRVFGIWKSMRALNTSLSLDQSVYVQMNDSA